MFHLLLPMAKDDEIKDLMAEERSRGSRRKKLDPDERRKRKQTEKHLATVLASGDEIEFMKILRETGLKDESPEFQHAMKVFCALRAGRS